MVPENGYVKTHNNRFQQITTDTFAGKIRKKISDKHSKIVFFPSQILAHNFAVKCGECVEIM